MTRCSIQWKSTDIGMDIKCKCGAISYVTGYFAYNIKCCVCGTIYKCSNKIELTELFDTPDEPVIETINPYINR